MPSLGICRLLLAADGPCFVAVVAGLHELAPAVPILGAKAVALAVFGRVAHKELPWC